MGVVVGSFYIIIIIYITMTDWGWEYGYRNDLEGMIDYIRRYPNTNINEVNVS